MIWDELHEQDEFADLLGEKLILPSLASEATAALRTSSSALYVAQLERARRAVRYDIGSTHYRSVARLGTFNARSVVCWFRDHEVADTPDLCCAKCARPLVPRVDFFGPVALDFSRSQNVSGLYLIVVRDHPPPVVTRPCPTLVLSSSGLLWAKVSPGARVEGVPFPAEELARLVYWTSPTERHRGLASIINGGVRLNLRPWATAAIHDAAIAALSVTTMTQLAIPVSDGPFR